MTAFYIFRLIFLAFFGESRVDEKLHVHESSNIMAVPMIILASLALIIGFLGIPPFNHSIFYGFLHADFKDAAAAMPFANDAPWYILSLVSVIAGLLGIYAAYLLYIKKVVSPEKIKSVFRPLYALSYNKFYIDEIYNYIIVKPLLALF